MIDQSSSGVIAAFYKECHVIGTPEPSLLRCHGSGIWGNSVLKTLAFPPLPHPLPLHRHHRAQRRARLEPRAVGRDGARVAVRRLLAALDAGLPRAAAVDAADDDGLLRAAREAEGPRRAHLRLRDHLRCF